MNPATLPERIRALSPQQKSLLVERSGNSGENGAGEKEIVAYVARRAGETISIDELRSALASQLPDFMVPAHFVFLDALPLNPNGKVDRNALPAPQVAPPNSAGEANPRNATEARLAAIWADVLKLQEIGADANFFRLGGHSLLALQVMAQVREAFAADLPLKTLFDHPTVAGLAKAIETFSAEPSAPRRPIAPRRVNADVVEPSLQET